MRKAGQIKKELLNTSEVAKAAGVNRATARQRLESKGVQPKQEKAKEKLYDADEALAAVSGDGVTTNLRKAQTAKTAAEAGRAKLKYQKEKGELVPIHDVRSDVQAIASRIYSHFMTRAATLAPKLRGQKVDRIEALLKQDAEQFFSALKVEHERYLSEPRAEDESSL
ncbi:MAG TPA: hypothetical protein VFS10_11375 [Pyrinomonadaceae bacterium]|nr:hypothetical protein [Pyrinomonadaceae bacterium]